MYVPKEGIVEVDMSGQYHWSNSLKTWAFIQYALWFVLFLSVQLKSSLLSSDSDMIIFPASS